MAAPTVTGIDVASGPPGTLVVISGSNFDDTIKEVRFGDYSAGSNFVVNSETELSAYVPAGSGTNLTVYVTNEDGTGSLANLWSYDDYEGGTGGGGGSAPVVSDLSPDTSAYDDGRGGDTVVITGQGFTTAIYVWFGDVQATFTIDSDTQISAIAPPGVGVVEVDVENAYGRSSDPGSANNFTYPTFSAPAFTAAISPQSGLAGQLVTITGSSLQYTTAVLFGDYHAVFEMVSDTVLKAWAPAGPTPNSTVDVVIVNPAGESAEPSTQSWNDFAYSGPPTGLTVTPLVNSVLISWNAVSSTLPVLYRVYVGESNPPTAIIATTAQTSAVYNISHDAGLRWYAVSYVDSYGNESTKCEAVSATALQNVAEAIEAGVIDSMEAFATDIIPPRVVSSLPSLPNPEYPANSIVILTSDGRLYKNVSTGPNSNSAADRDKWYDAVGANDGALNNFAYTDSSGWSGSGEAGDIHCLQFDGTDDYVSLTPVTGPSDGTWTWEAWVRPSSVQNGYIVYSGLYNPSQSPYSYFSLAISGSSGYCRALTNYKNSNNVLNIALQPSGDLNDGSWHHVVGVLDTGSTSLKLYVDGVQVAEKTPAAGTWSADRTSLGRDEDTSPTAYLAAGLAVVRGYSNALTAAQVEQNWRAGPTGSTYVRDGLSCEWDAKHSREGTQQWLPVVDAADAAGLISGSAIVGNSITAGQIAAGAIGADELSAGSVYAKHVVVGNYANLVPNPQSEWNTSGKDTSVTGDLDFRGVQSGFGYYSGSKSRAMAGAGSGVERNMIITPYIPARQGDEFYFSCYAKLYTASGSGYFRIVARDKDGNIISYGATDAVNSTTWSKHSVAYTMPANTVDCYVEFWTNTLATNNYLLGDELLFARKNEGSLIVDGAITADHIAAGSITADHIAGNYLYGTEIEGGTITGGTITGGTITGGVFKTETSGERIEILTTNKSRIDFYSGHSSEIANAFIESDIYDTLFSAIKIVGPTIGYMSEPASLSLYGCADGVTWGVNMYGHYATIVADNGIDIVCDNTSSPTVGLSMDKVATEVKFYGALKPADDCESGISLDGIWISDLYSGNNRWKLYRHYTGGQNYLYLRKDGTTALRVALQSV